jgi:hypothetical protein
MKVSGMQMYLLSLLTFVAFWFIVSYLVVRVWIRWGRRSMAHSAPKWRSWIAMCGFAASNVPLLMIMRVMGGGYFGHACIPDTPLGLLALRAALFAALTGIIAALVGTGPFAIPTVV